MNRERLLFAQARGAKLQMRLRRLNLEMQHWATTPTHISDPSRWDYRIQPGDEHLQYGQMSQALQWWAAQPKFSTIDYPLPTTHWYAARHYWLDARFPTDIDGGAPEKYNMTEVECRMLALFVAEYLADMGM